MAVKRAERVGPLVAEEIAVTLTRLDNPRLVGVTITRVKMSADLKIAHVYFSRIGTPEQIEAAQEGLVRSTGVFRRAIRENLDLRYLPQLEFHYDQNLEHADRIERILRELQLPREEPADEPEDEI